MRQKLLLSLTFLSQHACVFSLVCVNTLCARRSSNDTHIIRSFKHRHLYAKSSWWLTSHTFELSDNLLPSWDATKRSHFRHRVPYPRSLTVLVGVAKCEKWDLCRLFFAKPLICTVKGIFSLSGNGTDTTLPLIYRYIWSHSCMKDTLPHSGGKQLF